MQAAVYACTRRCAINLVNVVVAGSVNVPITHDTTFFGSGAVFVTGTGTAFLRYQPAYNSQPVSAMMAFEGLHFIKSNAGKIIWDNLFFNSGTNMGVRVYGCHFE